MAALVSTPSIPGKNQRILTNKQRGITNNSVTRIFNRNQYAQQVNEAKKKQQSFGTTQRRFDVKMDIKEVFSRDPGPGAYKNSVMSSTTACSESTSVSGFGNGFASKADRFTSAKPVDPQVGPGAYEPVPV